ncbi:His-Xaa-Ser repeat protein HxsA2 [Mycolicibacterium septicum]|uniref:His-Xaa-Ser repeat protein HxsA2 n=1 Tax=Mycolicibacterium septicum TaxID=98668 RepID=UPI003CED7C24
MREAPKIVSLTTALAALAGPAIAPPIKDGADSEGPLIATESEEGIRPEAEMSLPGDIDLMSFTVHQAADGTMFPQHGSHSSHSSHSSHVSHASSSPGYGGGGAYLPYVPNPVYVPPVYAPPVVAPPPASSTSPTTAPPSAAGSDPAYLACTRAANGLGVNQIAGELQQVYGLATKEAVSIAQQALASVLGAGNYCDAYLGE